MLSRACSENVGVELGEKLDIRCRAVYDGMARRVDQASRVRLQEFERGRYIIGKNGK